MSDSALTKNSDEYLIILDNVYKGFGSADKRVEPLKGVSLKIKRGESVVIIGPSGTGKSVTLRLIIGLIEPDAGNVFFENKNLSELDSLELNNIRKRMSMLFQSGALFDSMTIGENVAFPLYAAGHTNKEEIRELVAEKLRQVGLPDTEEKMPPELSGGMRKRAALARAIISQPEVILYDEPTTGLDPIMSDAIGNLVKSTHESLQNANITSIIVTHDMHIANKVADRIVMLYDGHIVGEGTPDMFERIANEKLTSSSPVENKMIQQFVRGEASGPIKTSF